MSRFFEFLHKVEPSSTFALPATSDTPEQLPEAKRILSVLHRPQGPGQHERTEEKCKPADLSDVAVENVEIRPSTRLVYHTDPTGPAADRFRLIRMRLHSLRNLGKLKAILVTSPMPNEGKSTIALNLAAALNEGGSRRVLLIEADLHHPSIDRQLGLTLNVGMTQCLEDGLNPLSTIKRVQPLNCYVLPAGRPPANPTELLQTEALPNLLQTLSPHFDWILLDSPPVIPLTDAVSLTHHADATLLVTRAGRTRQKDIEAAIALLGRKHVIGIVLNAAEGLDRAYTKYAGCYRSESPLIEDT